MPELPEVETVRRGLAQALEGRRIGHVEVRRGDLRTPLPGDFAARIEGRRVIRLDRRAKYLLWRLEGDAVVIAHLGMSGRFTVIPTGAPAGAPGPHDHVTFAMEDGARVVFTDPRRFGLMTLAREGELDAHPLLRELGPEPLGNAFNAEVLAEACRGRRAPIKGVLLDQRVVAGLGNIYACEALFRARISPRRQARTIPGVRAERLAAAIRTVLEEAIAAGGSSLRDYAAADGALGYFQHSFSVYGRAGAPCPGCDCKGAIRMIRQSGRSTFYCPQRQR